LGENVSLEVRRDLDDQQQLALIQFPIDLGRGYLHGGLECGPRQPLGDLPGEIRAVLIHNSDREIRRFSDGSGRDRVDGNAEREDDEN
jgi:hypothetical protein